MIKFLIFSFLLSVSFTNNVWAGKFVVSASAPKVITTDYFASPPSAGDTIYISSDRTLGLKFQNFYGNESKPIVFINDGGQVNINDADYWGALTFENCQYIKVTGTGDPNVKYGFKLGAQLCGLAFSELSSDCEAEFIEIDHTGYFGICAKKDYSGNPPTPHPVFKNLIIHDMYITHVLGEGMYLGETESPGMEFRHVRVYNNIVKNTGREGIQVSNMVEDVEVYNNVIINSGLNKDTYQMNNFQIGDNTVGKYYNNILIGAPAFGMIVMGSGDIEIDNNYYENNEGIFTDNRTFTIPYAPIKIQDNFFLKTSNNSVIVNYNELNPVTISGNQYDGSCTFLLPSTLSQKNLTATNNKQVSLSPVSFADTISYSVADNSVYKNMGPVSTAAVVMNDWPILDSLKTSYYVPYGRTTKIQLKASVADNDVLHFSLDTIPSYVSLVDSINGLARLVLKPTSADVGTCSVLVTVTDASHQAADRQMIQLTVAPPNNTAPQMKAVADINVKNLQRSVIPVYVSDADNDRVTLTLLNDLDFVSVKSVNDSTYNLIIKPKYLEVGTYSLKLSLTDSLSEPVIYTVPLEVEPSTLTSGTPVYRLDCGGGVDIEMDGDELNWEHVRLNSGKQYVKTYSWETGSGSYDGVNNTSAPSNIFGSFSYANVGTELQWKFPVINGKYKVNLFFRERETDFDENGNKSVFNVATEDSTVLSSFCMYDESGEYPLQKTFEATVKDQELNINFTRISGISKICGIEIIFLGLGNMPPVISPISDIQMDEGDTLTIPVHVSDDSVFNYNSSSIFLSNNPSFANLSIDTQSNTAAITLSPDYSSEGSYKNLKVKANDGEFSDSIVFNVTVNHKIKPNYPNWTLQNSITINEGDTITIKNIAFDPENDPFTVSISGADFAGVEKTDDLWNLVLTPDYYSAGTYTLSLTATDQNNYTSNFSVAVVVSNVNPQIILSPDMITDEITGGSVNSPNYLVDEQNLTPKNGGVPVSKSWMPAYNSDNAPFHATIDLGAVYDVTQVALHDMNNAGLFTVSVANNKEWQELYAQETDSYNEWRTQDIEISTRYLQLTFEAGSGAYVNEIVLYGTKVRDESVQESDYYTKPSTVKQVIGQIILSADMVTDEVTGGSLNSPNYLVDEQNLTPENGGVPVSKSWMPAYNSDNAPFHTTIDLGAVYDVTQVNLHDMNNAGLFTVSVANNKEWQELYAQETDSYNEWRTQNVEVLTRYLQLTFEAGSGAFVNEIVLYGAKVQDESVQESDYYVKPSTVNQEIGQIILSSDMVTDEVTGGSLDSPNYLVDEQSLNIDQNEHATSKCWNPYYNDDKAPYHATFDLGAEYVIKKICFHDMNNDGPMIISSGEPDNWTTLYTEEFDTFNNWLIKEVDVQTRYLRLTIEGSSGAKANEMMLFGYAVQKSEALKVQSLTCSKSSVIANTDFKSSSTNSEEIKVYPTVFSQDFHVEIQNDQSNSYDVSLYNSCGLIIFKDQISHSSLTLKTYPTSSWNLSPGIYILKIQKENSLKAFKLIKM